jgi:hypothetical protein
VAVLKAEGYEVHNVQVQQLGTSHKTNVLVLAPPGTTYKDIVTQPEKIKFIHETTENNGETWSTFVPPLSVSSRRIAVRYAEEGGAAADGVMYVRPGKDDLSLGGSHYAQVRVAVDGTHYLKGMAVYKDDLPPGVDIMFNTNKSKADAPRKVDAMKPLKVDKESGEVDQTNPFGSMISRQIKKTLPDGTEKATSAMNIVNEQGDWDQWSKSLSSQVLSKQTPKLAKTQLDKAYAQRKEQLDEIASLTNPAVRKKLLDSFSDDVDAAAVHMKAAALPDQRTQVIIPVNGLKDTEIYAPNFKQGERVALIRYPHGGTFEIPELTVNNNHREAKSLLGRAADAVGINSRVAERLSGADFDGDTVLVIPQRSGRELKSTPALEGLKNFDPKRMYPEYPGMKVMANTQTEMGVISNLITDMTIKGANTAELAAAVRHSMVVIDAEKHRLDYRKSASDNNITHLKKKYQGSSRGGASTLISKAKTPTSVPERKQSYRIDPVTGKKTYLETGASYVDKKTGQTVQKTSTVKKLEVEDAFNLSSGTKIEEVYAAHSNRMKDLANQARKISVNTKPIPRSPSATKYYKDEVASLDYKLHRAILNRPLERRAQLIANANYAAKKNANPTMDRAEEKKLKSIALETARARMNAKKAQIEFTAREWEAIQAGAISNSKLNDILNNANLDQVKQLATPKTSLTMTPAKNARAQALLSSGLTQAEVAEILGVGLTTLKKSLSSE